MKSQTIENLKKFSWKNISKHNQGLKKECNPKWDFKQLKTSKFYF
jgi:hypothetical protein